MEYTPTCHEAELMNYNYYVPIITVLRTEGEKSRRKKRRRERSGKRYMKWEKG